MNQEPRLVHIDIERSLASLARYSNMPGVSGFLLEGPDRDFLEDTMNEAVTALAPIMDRQIGHHNPSVMAVLMLGQNLYMIREIEG